MLALLQRVAEARVAVAGEQAGAIGAGLLVLLCVVEGDDEGDAAALAAKTARLRIFADDAGRLNRSVKDAGGAVLLVSQFTLAADVRRGNRPSFARAAQPETAKELLARFAALLEAEGLTVEQGVFGADMDVHLHNQGPVSLLLDSRELRGG
ncbi:MAG: D-tyrosyl-tRNA(Tyr) deacylase [Betaproteobacteria bacterium AqS2]|uniref:D-aminoacyl-tRNA deacylase n=1 Tax=Candidatus Amphirhobacter heronislandensis TaxID=1732024 RepID=A0A930UD77_9GAMM|nr:D-tyrosyl-tRNA(Tyr) deacylase [Betaproteobacteria bacterium AqS2]